MVLDIANIALKIFDKLTMDPTEKAKAQLEVLKLNQDGEFREMENDLKVALAQADINKVEAGGNWYQAGWRPTTGYVCVAGLAYQFLGQPLLAWLSGIWGWPIPPTLDFADLLTILGGMLGLAGMRTKERLNGKT